MIPVANLVSTCYSVSSIKNIIILIVEYKWSCLHISKNLITLMLVGENMKNNIKKFETHFQHVFTFFFFFTNQKSSGESFHSGFPLGQGICWRGQGKTEVWWFLGKIREEINSVFTSHL